MPLLPSLGSAMCVLMLLPAPDKTLALRGF